MPLRLSYFYNFDLKGLDEISQCPATARVADSARGLWHHFHVAWLSDAGASNECNAGTFCAAWLTWLLRLYIGSDRTLRRRIASCGNVYSRGGAATGDRDGSADVEGVSAAQLYGCE